MVIVIVLTVIQWISGRGISWQFFSIQTFHSLWNPFRWTGYPKKKSYIPAGSKIVNSVAEMLNAVAAWEKVKFCEWGITSWGQFTFLRGIVLGCFTCICLCIILHWVHILKFTFSSISAKDLKAKSFQVLEQNSATKNENSIATE